MPSIEELVKSLIAEVTATNDLIGKRIAINEPWKFKGVLSAPGDYSIRMIDYGDGLRLSVMRVR